MGMAHLKKNCYESMDSMKAGEFYQDLSDYWLFKEVYVPWR